jgi:hypothetical protein
MDFTRLATHPRQRNADGAESEQLLEGDRYHRVSTISIGAMINDRCLCYYTIVCLHHRLPTEKLTEWEPFKLSF